ncbi:MFS transporter [Acidomonas methanolica]|uniref:Major facilitator superfamily multidrug resistance transporter n=1 Tax=Acidomonas methanolica NBRC 104435 TaxID=1231351 RepID=A0A023D5T0_ACIMT|nr:MFS transporter [Acidomonas methanolica]MBU2653084.1 MFS transporter [Acidomonas methanolica]TCS27201.1 DHA2 family multidrug resistance protein [Acidomonas methanolica]GAJ29110.1 major facilitator superfamily multidrug resistance transporter [Acidomonas methanolica NBRC 104435]GBQ46987.1 multidrug resistance protein [Acidomonas methanolica]GEK99964.1 MFS transporter [Acidomonas methanolica NBRC 104435]
MTSEMRGQLLTGSCGVCAAWMVMMSTRFFALSLPDIEGTLGIGPDEGSWLTAGYLAFEPVGVGLGCWLAVIFSLRRIMLLAITLFATSSAIAAMTHDLTVMILARSGMGLAAGIIIPLAIITELRTFPPTWRALAIGLYASAATMAPQAAASLDVWLVERWGTPAIFWIAILLGMVAFVCGYLGLWRERIRWLLFARADLRVVTLFSMGTILLGGGLSQGNRLHWSETPLILSAVIIGAALLLGAFWLGGRRVVHPILMTRLLTRRNALLGALIAIPYQFASVLSGGLVPAFLVDIPGYRPEQIAPVLDAAFWPQAVAYPACIVTLRYGWMEARTFLVLGFGLNALACLLDLNVTSDWIPDNFVVGQILQGIGLPWILLPLLMLFVGDVVPSEGLYAAAIFNVARSLAGTVATAWAATGLRLRAEGRYGELLASTGLQPHHRTLAAWNGLGALPWTTPDRVLLDHRARSVVGALVRHQSIVIGFSTLLADLALMLAATCVIAACMPPAGADRPGERS